MARYLVDHRDNFTFYFTSKNTVQFFFFLNMVGVPNALSLQVVGSVSKILISRVYILFVRLIYHQLL